MDLALAVRSPGSALKPFIYGLAFELGIAHPETILEDRRQRFGLYAPENFDLNFKGQVSARYALQQSLNVPAIELLNEVTPARFLARLRNAGADLVMPTDAAPGLAIGIGGVGIRLTDLTRLYAGLARGGRVPELIERSDLPRPPMDRRITEPAAAWYLWDVLKGAPPPDNALGGRIAFKTGTSYGYRDAFAVGYDRRTTIGVWVGRADNGAVPGLVGRQVAAPILFDAFARLGPEREALVKPPGILTGPNAALPPPMRHLRKDVPKTAITLSGQLRIAYPPEGARVDLGLSRGSAEAARLALKAQGGAPPFTWLINGIPVGEPDLRRQTAWAPDGAGFARISVMDAHGASASVSIRLE
jgi:penicillin-binding protein 1C